MTRKTWLALAGVVVVLGAVVVAWMLSRPGDGGQKIVKVAIILPQTGPQAAIGRGATNSVRLAFKQAEQELRSKGITVELLILDDASKPETAVTQAQKATSDPSVVLAIAHFNTPCALATVQTFHDARLPVIVPAAVGAQVTANGYPEIVRTCNTDVGQAIYMAKYLVEVLKAKRIYALDDSSAFGTGLIKALAAELGKLGIKFIGSDSFHVGDVDFAPVLARVKSASPDVIVLGCMAAEGALLRKQMVEQRVTTSLIGFSGIFYETFIEAAGEAANGTMAIFPLPPLKSLPGGTRYEAAYHQEGFSEPYESAGPFGYVAGQVATRALLGGSTTREAIVQSLHKGPFDTAFGPISFDSRGEMSLQMYAFYRVDKGKWAMTHAVDKSGSVKPQAD